jgi:hypothetical protein
MTTANQLIERAYALLGYKDPGEALSADDADYALNALNDMIDSWTTQRLFIVSVAEVVTSVSGQTVTIGPSMTVNTARPVKLEQGAFHRVGGIDYPLTLIDRETYNSISLKAVSSTIPEYGYYDAAMPTGTIYLWPYSTTALALHLQLQVQLTEFADLATDYTLAPGYRRAISYSLAEELAPGVRELSPLLIKQAALARNAIKRTNVRVPVMTLNVPMAESSNILAG